MSKEWEEKCLNFDDVGKADIEGWDGKDEEGKRVISEMKLEGKSLRTDRGK